MRKLAILIPPLPESLLKVMTKNRFSGIVAAALFFTVAPIAAQVESTAHSGADSATHVTLGRTRLNSAADFHLQLDDSHPDVAVILLINDMFTQTYMSRAQTFDFVTGVLNRALGRPAPRIYERIDFGEGGYPFAAARDRDRLNRVLEEILREDEAFYNASMNHRMQLEDLAYRAFASGPPFQFAIAANHNSGGENEIRWSRKIAEKDNTTKFHFRSTIQEEGELIVTLRSIDVSHHQKPGSPGAMQPLSNAGIVRQVLESAIKSLDPNRKMRFVIFVQSYGNETDVLCPALNVRVAGGKITPENIVQSALAVQLPGEERGKSGELNPDPVIMQISRQLEQIDGSESTGVSKLEFLRILESLEVPVPLVIWNCPNAALERETEKMVANASTHLGTLYTLESPGFPAHNWDFAAILSDGAIAEQRQPSRSFDQLLQSWLDSHLRSDRK